MKIKTLKKTGKEFNFPCLRIPNLLYKDILDDDLYLFQIRAQFVITESFIIRKVIATFENKLVSPIKVPVLRVSRPTRVLCFKPNPSAWEELYLAAQ